MALDKDILIDEDGESGVVSAVYEFLGIQREQYVCPDCGTACEPAYTYDPARAAFDGGKSPSWYCEGCDTHYVREVDDASHTMDLYGRK